MDKDKANTKDKLSEEKLEQVSGGVSPFKDIPRVPNADIDDNLREKG